MNIYSKGIIKITLLDEILALEEPSDRSYINNLREKSLFFILVIENIIFNINFVSGAVGQQQGHCFAHRGPLFDRVEILNFSLTL